ncbi:MAG: serine hydrolase [Myxococcota bacterium]
MIILGWAVALSYGQDFIDIPSPMVPACADAAWPGETWDSDAALVSRELPNEVAALDAAFFPPSTNFAARDRAGVRTDSVVVVHRGRILYERYRVPWTVTTPHLAWSVTKSITSALTGIAERDGLIDRDDSVCKHLGGLPEASCAVTVQHLLDMASGFEWRESYEGGSPTQSSVLAMLYGEGSADMAGFVGRQPLARAPGSAWQYSSGDTNLLSAAIGGRLKAQYGERFPWVALFDVLGMKHTTFERDAAGTYVGSSYVWATPRDLARFGYLMLHNGCWDSEPLLPENWVADATTIAEPLRKGAIPNAGRIPQARLFWVNQTLPEQGVTEPWCPSVGDDMYAALGHWGQSITVVPSRELVVVRMADDRDGSYRHDDVMKRVIALVEAW